MRNSFISRILCLLLAVFFLNFSVDSRDADPDSVPEDLSINDIESLAELLAEVVFEWNDAFEEYDERDSDEGGMLDITIEFLGPNDFSISIKCPFDWTKTDKHIPHSVVLPSPSEDVTSPPPKG
ncbi:MAG TPA: hypothetical protein VFE50_24680 [Cyclobacteriaceae bacterium]|nr:hypothetical protein [Cyclobacteriaceae bacterium]